MTMLPTCRDSGVGCSQQNGLNASHITSTALGAYKREWTVPWQRVKRNHLRFTLHRGLIAITAMI